MNDNPTESGPQDEGAQDERANGRDINAEKEAMLRKYIARQRKLHRESLKKIDDLGRAHNKFILACGSNEVVPRRKSKGGGKGDKQAVDEELSRQATGSTMFERAFQDLQSVLNNSGLIDGDQ